VGPRADLDTEVTGKTVSPLLVIEPRSPGRPVRGQTLTELPRLPRSFKLSVIVRKELLKALAAVSGSYIFPLPLKINSICSDKCTLPVYLFLRSMLFLF
jgi:hypothetical protein